jgi:transcriptional regulator with XRE-family HTH domain
MEAGERPPPLPELEIFAYFLEIPLEHFWGNEVLPANGNVSVPDPAEVKQLRQNAIGELIKKARADAALSVDELAGLAGIQSQDLDAYESGASAIPLPELEILTRTLNSSMSNFENQEGTVGGWFAQQRSMREFLSLSKELQDFVGKPINKPYLELAIKISELKTERLRALAEGLLEITY